MRTEHHALLRSSKLLTAAGLVWASVSAPAAAAQLSAGDPATTFNLETILEGAGQPTDIAVLPDGRKVITLRGGDIVTILANDDQVEDHIDVVLGDAEQGLLGVIADPNFATNQYLYFYASAGQDQNNRHQVQRYKLGADSKLDEVKILIDMGLRGPANHNGGGLDFYQGSLYVSVGDTGNNNTPPTNKFGTCLNVANGKILRINPDTGMPADGNPLSALTEVTGCTDRNADFSMQPPDKRIFAWGMRNPFRFQVDQQTGKLWVGEVGEGAREEISVGEAGTHFGWPFFEGSVEYNQTWKGTACQGVTPARACTPNVYEYPHSDGRNCVVGGVIMNGCGWPAAWKTRYVFGDHGSKQIWTLDVNDTRTGVVANSLKPFATDVAMSGFRMGLDGALYIAEEGNGGRVHRITPKVAEVGVNCDAPAGGAGGAGGAAAGGMSGGGAGGGSNPAGGNATGGTGNGTAGSGNAGMPAVGGTTATGTAGAGGTNGTQSAAPSGDESGCGCRLPGQSSSSGLAALALGALGMLVRVARRRRQVS